MRDRTLVFFSSVGFRCREPSDSKLFNGLSPLLGHFDLPGSRIYTDLSHVSSTPGSANRENRGDRHWFDLVPSLRPYPKVEVRLRSSELDNGDLGFGRDRFLLFCYELKVCQSGSDRFSKVGRDLFFDNQLS